MGNHRADRRADRGVGGAARTKRPPGGRRRAEPSTMRRRRLASGLPLVPTLAGVLAVGVAAAGAITVGTSSVDAHDFQAASARILSAGELQPMLNSRQAAISRDSQRVLAADRAQARLEQTAQGDLARRNAALSSINAATREQAAVIEKNQWVLPIPKGLYTLTARFGQTSGLWSHFHTGLDFAAPVGTPIHAVASGVITSVGWDGAYGNLTKERLPDGTVLYYAHQTAYTVAVGQQVTANEVIGSVGATGNVTGPHVHLEVRPRGQGPVDPYPELVAHGLQP